MDDEDSGIFQSRTESASFAESDLTKFDGSLTSGSVARSLSSDSEHGNTDIEDISSLSDDGNLSSSEDSDDDSSLKLPDHLTSPLQPPVERKRLCINDSLPHSTGENSLEGIHNLVPGLKLTCKEEGRDERWEFGDGNGVFAKTKEETSTIKPTSSPKRVLKLQLSSLSAESRKSASYSSGASTDDDNFVENMDGRAAVQSPFLNEHLSNASTYGKVHLELRDPESLICREWQTLFGNDSRVRISCQHALAGKLENDALVIPGNSFGFLDGEPEIRYTEKFGWKLQEYIQKKIWEKHDGELLVGQSLKVPLDDCNGTGLKYAIYVPVMRVPLQVGDTVNAYLAFRAALREVKYHNKQCPEEQKISSILCPALCNGFGSMPAGRIALQMKAAYDAVITGSRNDLLKPKDLGAMATSHVEMSTKLGGRGNHASRQAC